MKTPQYKIADLPPVARTLLIPLAYRALESQRPDAILRDERAVELISQFDEDFTALVRNLNIEQVGTLMRTCQFDQYTRSFLALNPAGTVIDIGCGLDTRFERVDNGLMRWYGLDFPEVISLRQQLLPAPARGSLIAGSALDFGWMDTLENPLSPKIFLAEGVFPYFTEGDARRLISKLADQYPGSELVFDAISPLSKAIHQFHPGIRKTGIHITWGLAHGKELEGWRSDIHLLEECLYFDQDVPRLGAYNLVRHIPFMNRMNYILHLRLG